MLLRMPVYLAISLTEVAPKSIGEYSPYFSFNKRVIPYAVSKAIKNLSKKKPKSAASVFHAVVCGCFI